MGRLVAEKGILTLLRAFEKLDLALKVVGDGPLRAQVEEECSRLPAVEYLGQLRPEEVLSRMQRAQVVVVPSEWAEAFGLVVIESFACATPVIAARSGALPDLVIEGQNGYTFEAGQVESLRQALRRFQAGPCLRAQARASYEHGFTAESNYRQLIEIYEDVARC